MKMPSASFERWLDNLRIKIFLQFELHGSLPRRIAPAKGIINSGYICVSEDTRSLGVCPKLLL